MAIDFLDRLDDKINCGNCLNMRVMKQKSVNSTRVKCFENLNKNNNKDGSWKIYNYSLIPKTWDYAQKCPLFIVNDNRLFK